MASRRGISARPNARPQKERLYRHIDRVVDRREAVARDYRDLPAGSWQRASLLARYLQLARREEALRGKMWRRGL